MSQKNSKGKFFLRHPVFDLFICLWKMFHAKYSVCANQVDAGREVCLEKRVLGGMQGWVQAKVQKKDHGKTTWESFV